MSYRHAADNFRPKSADLVPPIRAPHYGAFAMVRRRSGTSRVLVIVRRITAQLRALRGSRSWRRIATPERLSGSLSTLAAELEQALEENARDTAVMPLVAEIVVVATELSLGYGEDFYLAVEGEVRRREDIAAWSGLLGSPAAAWATTRRQPAVAAAPRSADQL